MDVEIDGHGPDLQTLDTGFLGGFSEGDTGKVGIAVGVSAGLDPDLQLGVEQHECAFEVGVDHERGAGEMAGTFVTLERVGSSIEQLPHALSFPGERRVVDRLDHSPDPLEIVVLDEFGSVGAQPAGHAAEATSRHGARRNLSDQRTRQVRDPYESFSA